MLRPTRPAPRPAVCPASCITSCIAFFLLAIGTAGCGSPAVRPDAHVARIVEREDLRQARSADRSRNEVEPIELASAGVALEALELVYVPDTRKPDPTPAPARAPVPTGWHEAPASWLILPAADLRLPADSRLSGDDQGGEAQSFFLSLDGDGNSDAGDDSDGRKGGGGRSKPRVRMDLFKLKINDNPVSFSGSLKGSGNLLLRATIRF
jgi:hypothetical protein